jgi:tetratricopeptide (TPR) repeat protein
VDENSGGFYLFTMGRPPARPRPEADFFLPGSDSMFAKAARLERAREFPAAARAYREIAAGLPWYGHAVSMAGHGLGLVRDYKGAMKLMERGVKLGVVDMANIPEYGVSLLETGRPVEANPYLAQALPVFVNQYDPIRLNLAWTWVQKAMGELLKGRTKEAEVMLDTAENLLVPELVSTYIQYAGTRKFFLAQVLTLKAEAALKRGDPQAARERLKAALECDPGGRMERDIRARLDALATPAGGKGWFGATPAGGGK